MNNINLHINQKSFGIDGIYNFIPQRPPFLMIDEVINLDINNQTIICKKLISPDEWYLKGHFPNKPIMPGVLMVEAMAQASSILGKALVQNKDGILLFAGIKECRFLDTASINNTLIIESKIVKIKDPLLISDCCVKLNDKIIVNCQLKAFRKEI